MSQSKLGQTAGPSKHPVPEPNYLISGYTYELCMTVREQQGLTDNTLSNTQIKIRGILSSATHELPNTYPTACVF